MRPEELPETSGQTCQSTEASSGTVRPKMRSQPWHRGRYSLHTASKTDYDRGMGQYARQYLSGGANSKLYEFLRLDFGQLQHRHGRVLGVVLPRAKILPVPVG